VNTDQAHATLHALGHAVPDELLNFARAMDEADHGPAVDGWAYFLSRPEKWVSEYIAWVESGRPDPDLNGWPMFLDALEAMDNARA
jgi:hypothetical protein